MQTLIEACTAKGYRQMVAVIGDSANHGSIALHRELGFTQVALLPNLGYKFGRWLDSVMMQRTLGEGGSTLPER
jgi:phosphinothricin acetyltransferase